MHEPLPVIRYADYIDTKPPVLPPSDSVSEAPRARHGSDTESTHDVSRFRIMELYLRRWEGVNALQTLSHDYPTHRNHADIASDANHRVLFIPVGRTGGAAAEVCWRIEYPERVQGGRLELFIKNDANRIWHQDLTAHELTASPGLGGVPNAVWSAWNWDGSLPAIDNGHDAKFPNNRVTAQFAPYKLKLTIWGAKRDRVTEKTQAWTYIDVPFDSKYKIVRYVPSTEFGGFEVNYDAGTGNMEIVTRLAIGFNVAFSRGNPNPPWDPGRKNNRFNDIRNRIPGEWGDRYGIVASDNGRQLEMTPFVSVVQAHQADVQGTAMQSVVDVVANAAFVNTARTNGAHFYTVLWSGEGQSGIIPASNEATLNLFDPSAFVEFSEGWDEQVVGGGTRRNHSKIATGNNFSNLAKTRTAVIDWVNGGGGGAYFAGRVYHQNITSATGAPLVDGDAPILTVMHEPDSPTKSDPTAQLRAFADFLNGLDISCTMAIIVTGVTGRGDRKHRGHPNRGVERAANCAGLLRAALRAPGAVNPAMTAAQRAAQAGFEVVERHVSEKRGEPRVEIEIGLTQGATEADADQFRDRAAPYNALVHEFGHVFGYPDEYQNYNLGSARSLAPSQPRCIHLSRLYHVPPPSFPQPGGEDINANLMSSGAVWHPRYYVTLAEAVRNMFALPPRTRLPAMRIAAKTGGLTAAAVGAPFHTAFTNLHMQDAVNAGENAIRGGQRDVAQIRQAVQNQINPHLGAAELRYTRVAERDGVVDTTRVRTRKVLVAAGVASGDVMLHCATVSSPPSLPWIEAYPGFERFNDQEARVPTESHDAPGCFVHLQTVGNHRGNEASHFKVQVRCPPREKKEAWLRTRNNNITLHAAADSGAAAVGTAMTVNGVNCTQVHVQVADYNEDGIAEFWIRGAVVSGAAGDTGLDLLEHDNNPPNPGDIIDDLTITVVDVTLRARVPITPAKSARPIRRAVIPNGPPGAQMAVANVAQPLTQPAAAPQEYDLLALVQNNRVAATGPLTVRTFEDNPPLVLVRGSLPGGSHVEAEVTVAPAAVQNAMQWDAVRASDDAVAGPAPTLAAGGAAHQHRVALDQSGSFHLHARYQGESVAVLNLVIVEAVLANAGDDGTKAGMGSPEIGHVGQDGYKVGIAPMVLRDIVSFHSAPTRQNCMQMYAEVRLLGGGPDRRRGVNKVYAAWIQNKADNDVWGEYTDTTGVGPARRVTMIYAENKDQAGLARPAADFYFRPGEVPTPLAVALGPGHPVLDTSRQGESGLDCALSGARTERQDEAQGVLLKVSSGDGPGTEFYVDHPCDANYRLSSVRYRHGFCAYLCLWTNVVGNGDSPARAEAGVADRRFAVIRRVDWEVDGQWTVRWPNAGPAGHGAPAVEGRYRARIANRHAAVNAVVPAENTDLEPYYPTALNVFAWDAR